MKMRKLTTIALAAVILSWACSGAVFADNADDGAWIAQCLKDNTRADNDASKSIKYCECMNGKMPADETASITKWEESHADERKECEKKAGWDPT
jgi:hypothetical protein